MGLMFYIWSLVDNVSSLDKQNSFLNNDMGELTRSLMIL